MSCLASSELLACLEDHEGYLALHQSDTYVFLISVEYGCHGDRLRELDISVNEI